MPSLVSFTLTDDPHVYGLEMALSNILMIGLFRSNNNVVIFPKTEKKSYSSKHVDGLKLQPIQLLEAVVSSSQIHFKCIEDNNQSKAPVSFS